jgi:hypothetical protein
MVYKSRQIVRWTHDLKCATPPAPAVDRVERARRASRVGPHKQIGLNESATAVLPSNMHFAAAPYF